MKHNKKTKNKNYRYKVSVRCKVPNANSTMQRRIFDSSLCILNDNDGEEQTNLLFKHTYMKKRNTYVSNESINQLARKDIWCVAIRRVALSVCQHKLVGAITTESVQRAPCAPYGGKFDKSQET